VKVAFVASECVCAEGTVKDALVLTEDGVVQFAGSRERGSIPEGASVVDLGSCTLAPGYVDMHIHGSAGHDVMEGKPEALAAIERYLAAHGTTSYCPTTVTAHLDPTLRALECLADDIEDAARHEPGEHRARPLGVHLEGPFISKQKAGAHPVEHIRDGSVELFDRLWQAARGHVSVMTIAPEIPGAEDVIREATRRGVCISLGHSNATMKETLCGVKSGGRHVTHAFNAMRSLDHREPGILGFALTEAQVTAEIIVDGVHVDPAVVRLFLKAKGPSGAVLVTDALSATGMPDGQYQLGGFTVDLQGDVCMSNGRLAGSVLTLGKAVRNVMKFAGWGLEDAVRLASANPARTLGVEKRKGVIAPGADADFVVLTADGEIVLTIVGGAA